MAVWGRSLSVDKKNTPYQKGGEERKRIYAVFPTRVREAFV